MRSPIIAWLLVGVLVFTVVVGGITYYVGSNQSYQAGEDAGTTAGYASGKNDGYKSGYAQGKSDGYNQGYTQGKNDGYSAGENYGYSVGKTDGTAGGKFDGYNQGIDTERAHVISVINGLDCKAPNKAAADGSKVVKYTPNGSSDFNFYCP